MTKGETTVGVFLLNQDFEILVVKQQKNGKWSIPKGKPSSQDPILFSTALRELKEETGVDIKSYQKDEHFSDKVFIDHQDFNSLYKNKKKALVAYFIRVDYDFKDFKYTSNTYLDGTKIKSEITAYQWIHFEKAKWILPLSQRSIIYQKEMKTYEGHKKSNQKGKD